MNPPGPRTAAALVVLLTLAALALRLWGIGAMLPVLPEPDNCYLTQVSLVADGSPEAQVRRDYAKYPHLIARILQALPEERAATGGESLKQHLELAGSSSLRPRLVIACIAALLVPATFLIARRFMSPWWALLAAALSAVSLLHVNFSHQGRPHAAAAALATLTVAAAMRVQRRGTWSDYAWAGVAAALAISTLQSGVAVLLPLSAAHLLHSGHETGRARWRALVWVAVLGAALAAFYPFLFNRAQSEEPRLAWEDGAVQQGYHTVRMVDFDGSGFRTVSYSLWSYDPVLLCASLAALALWLFDRFRRRASDQDRRGERLVVLAYVLPYLLVIGLFSRTFERFTMPLIPFLACFAAWGLARVFAAREGKRFAWLAAVALLALPAYASARLAWLHARPDSSALAAQWVRENTTPERERMVLMPRLDLPLFRSQADLDTGGVEFARPWVYPWIHYQLGLPRELWTGPRYRVSQMPMYTGTFWQDLHSDPSAALRALEVDLAVFATWSDGTQTQQGTRIVLGLDQVATPVARFAPFVDAEGVERPLWFQQTDSSRTTFIGSVLQASFCGPAIAIYRFKRS
jgi:4-amino-4-deoxy-L-arabinose transferase-like glycosyltransferase